MTAFWFISPAMCLVIRFYLQRENRRRQLFLESNDSAEGSEILDTGSQAIHIKDEDLDQTDRQNLKFLYPL